MADFPVFYVFATAFIVAAASSLIARKVLRKQSDDLKRLNAELGDLLAQRELLMDSMPIYIYAEDADNGFRHVFCNKICGELWGLPTEQVIGKSDFDLFGDSEEIKAFRRTDIETMEKGTLREDVLPFTGTDGRRRIGRFFRKGMRFSDGRRWLLSMVVDITEQCELAENQRALNACFYEMLAQDGVAAADIVLKTLCERLGASRCYVLRFDDERRTVYPEREYRAPSATPPLSELKPFPFARDERWYKFLALGGMIFAPDVAAPAAVERFGLMPRLNKMFGVRSVYAMRLVVEGKVWGNFGVSYETTPHTLTAHEREFFLSAAHLLEMMFERSRTRARLELALEKRNASVRLMEFGSELTQSAFFHFNRKTRRVSGTKNFEDLYPSSDGMSLPPEEWICPEDIPSVREKMRALDSGASRLEKFDFRSDYYGERRYYRVLLSRDDAQVAPVFFGAIQNVTEIAHNAARMKESQELCEQVMNASPAMFFAKDADAGFKYVLCNRAFADFVGRTVEEVVGKTDAEIFAAPAEAAHYVADDTRVMQNPKGETFEEYSTNAKGETRAIRTTKIPFTGANERKLLLGACDDVTDLRHMIAHEQVNGMVLAQVVAEPDFKTVLERISDTILGILKCDRVLFSEYAEKSKGMRLLWETRSDGVHSIRDVPSAIREKIWKDSLASTLMNGQSILRDDIRDAAVLGDFLAKHPDYPIRSYAVSPVFVQGEFWGILTVSYARPHAFHESDKNLMAAMCNIVALAQIRERQNLAVKLAEAENQMILDNISIPLWLYDERGVVVRANKSAKTIFGTSQVGMPPYACRELTKCGFSMEECPVYRAFKEKGDFQVLHRYNGREYVIDARAITNAAGAVVNVVRSAVDVTRLNRLIGNQAIVNDCLANLIREGDMDKALELSLKTACEHIGATRAYIFRFDTEARTISSLTEYAKDGKKSVLGEYKNRPYCAKPDWEERFVAAPYLAIPDLLRDYKREGLESWGVFIERYGVHSLHAYRVELEGRFWGYIGLLFEDKPRTLSDEDVAFLASVAHCVELMLVRGKYQREVLDALERARAADKAKSYFLASMSHEIRTPLNAVIGFAELLKDEKLPAADRKEYLSCVSSAGNALLALINDVLDLSKLEAGQMVFSPVAVDFGALVRELGDIFRQKCAAKKVVLRAALERDFPIVFIDELRMRQILFNLIGNAVKFTPKGSITVSGRFEKRADGKGRLSFAVADTGVGICEEDRKRLFQFFAQARDARGHRSRENGTGLGLAIVSRMLDKMKGAISVASEMGKGTTVSVTLDDVGYGDAPKAGARAASAETDAGEPPPPCRKVLIVDDVPVNLRVMSAMLKKLGAETTTAADVAHAWKLLCAAPYDFLLTDIWLDGESGVSLAKKARADARFKNLKICAVTADTESEHGADAALFDAVLTKPVSVARVRTLLRDGV